MAEPGEGFGVAWVKSDPSPSHAWRRGPLPLPMGEGLGIRAVLLRLSPDFHWAAPATIRHAPAKSGASRFSRGWIARASPGNDDSGTIVGWDG